MVLFAKILKISTITPWTLPPMHRQQLVRIFKINFIIQLFIHYIVRRLKSEMNIYKSFKCQFYCLYSIEDSSKQRKEKMMERNVKKNNFENWKHWSFKKCTWKNEKTRNHHLHFISSEQIIYPHARLTRTCPQVHVILKCSMLSIFIVFYIRITSWYNSFNIYGIMGRIGIYFIRNLPNDWFFLYCTLSCFKTFLMEIDCAIFFFVKTYLKK